MASRHDTGGSQSTVALAMAGTAFMLAHQVAGKAARDGFFLSQFDAFDLPKMVAAGALLSLVLAVLFSRLLERIGPRNLIPATFLASAILHIFEWFTVSGAPRAISVVIYLHIIGLGAILLSGFWSLFAELFDPREARRRFGRIAGAGTGGGIIGGLLAERLVALTSADSLLILLAVLHLACAVVAAFLRPEARTRRTAGTPTVVEALRRTPLLWRLALLVFLGTCSAALLDYLFKLGATMSMGRGPGLVRFFAIYYTGAQAVTFLLQILASSTVVERLGIAKSVASLPVGVGFGSIAALLVPLFPLAALVRAAELVLRGSLFRTGYELLYTPVPPPDKRAVKTIVDVGCDRLGDAAGAGAVQLMMWLGPALARPEILGLAIVLSVISAALALRLDPAYRDVLAQGLVDRASEEQDEPIGAGDSLVNTVFEGMPSLRSLPAIRPSTRVPLATSPPPKPENLAAPTQDRTLARLAELRSQDPVRVKRALESEDPWDPLLAPQVIRLLAWDEVTNAARAQIERRLERLIGQLCDALTDPRTDFAIRRRIPRLLAKSGTQRGMDALIHGLDDARFEVRSQCGRALDYLKRRSPHLHVPESTVFAIVERELSVSKTIWESRRILDPLDTSPDGQFLEEGVQSRGDQSLEHVFALMAAVLPRDAVMAAFHGLHQTDRGFRGLALEYLDNALPSTVRERLWLILEETPVPERRGDSEHRRKVEDELLRTNASMTRAPVVPRQV